MNIVNVVLEIVFCIIVIVLLATEKSLTNEIFILLI